MKFWNEMNEAEREAFKLTDAYNDPTNPAQVTWGEWSDAAVGAVFRAHRKRKPVGVFNEVGQYWFGMHDPSWADLAVYRLPPEPKRETVRMFGCWSNSAWIFGEKRSLRDTHAITFPTLDGKPVLTKCPNCGTAPIDMEEL